MAKYEEIITSDLSKFGFRELGILKDILIAWEENGLPDDFYTKDVKSVFNARSGNVFLTNSEFQVAMLNDDGELESFYTLSYSGREGFIDDLYDEFLDESIATEDLEELIVILETNNMLEEANEVREKLEELED